MKDPTQTLRATEEGQFDSDAIVDALAARFTVARGATRVVRRARLDTFDRRLRKAGLTLEHQALASGERLVLGQLDGTSTAEVPVAKLKWPAMADVLPEGPVRDAILPVAGIRALMVADDEKQRMRVLNLQNEDGKTVARIELDEPASAPIVADAEPSQLTVRAMRGYDQSARQAVRLLTDIGFHAVEPDRESPRKRPTVARSEPATVLLVGALRVYLQTMRESLPGLLEDVDTEFLHDFRVAVRRTRATLKLGRPCLPEEMRTRWEPAFKELGDMTSPVRDLDVYVLDLPIMGGWLVAAGNTDLEPLVEHLRSRRAAKRRVLVRGLKSARFQRLFTDWDEALAVLADAPVDRKNLTAGQLADRGIRRAYRRVLRMGAAISPTSVAGDLHSLRKRCKDLRYALEVCSPVISRSHRRRAVAELKGLQDVLGRFQDSEVQRRALHGFAEEMMADGTPAAAVLAMGELIGHLDSEQDRARSEFDGAFAQFSRQPSQRLMKRLAGGK